MMKSRNFILSVLALTVALGWLLFSKEAPLDETPDQSVHTHVLSNGMKVLVIENHRAPVVVSQIWYRIGASYEHDGITGVSHVLEHMMFKGTKKHPPGEFSEIIAANGGDENAFTGQDYTAYFQKIAADRLEICLEMEADRMRNLLFQAAEFKKEIEVVKEERRMRTEDKPMSLTYERFMATAFTNSPYRRPIVGWMEDLDSMTVDDAKRWYQTWYAPNNATLVVAGDVEAEQVFRLARQYFSAIPRGDIPEVKPRRETRQHGTRRISVELPAKLPYLIMGYKAPVLKHVEEEWEVYALEVLAGVLDGGDSARLSRHLIRGQEIASSAGASYGMSGLYDTLFVLSAVPNEGVSLDVLEFALREQIQRLKSETADAAELDRVKAQVVAAQVYKQDSVFYQAMEVGMLDAIGLPWQLKDEYVDKVMAITPEQVRAVAQKYLVDESLTVATLEPLPLDSNVDDSSKTQAEEKE